MEQIVVKTEMQPNGEILLFYVDENAEGNEENQVLQLQDASEYEILEAENLENVEQQQSFVYETGTVDTWTDDEASRLLIFYMDNKDQFLNGTTKKEHLWTVACKAMLTNKTPQNCETKLNSLRQKYSSLRTEQRKGVKITWPLYDLCHQTFHNDNPARLQFDEHMEQVSKIARLPVTTTVNENNGVFTIKTLNANKTDKDDKVEMLLNLYQQYNKSSTSRRSMWENIAIELGEEDADYWHKRFLNFKQHYLRMLAKRESDGFAQINWPYMNLFDKIFENDADFQKKYNINPKNREISMKVEVIEEEMEWNSTECTILAKYYFDCYDEFQDNSIPVNFLWNEVGRLLDKGPDDCRQKYDELKNCHLDNYINGGYDLRSRKPVDIIFDNIISKDIEAELNKYLESGRRGNEEWSTEELDELIQFLYENVDMLKDPVCYYVCWASLCKKLGKSVVSCKKQWDDLKNLYKSILDDKMENPDLQIDWRYIDLFDRIFDYGMNTEFLFNFDSSNAAKQNLDKYSKKNNLKIKSEAIENGTDDEDYDEKGYTKRTKRGVGESKAFKILEFYQKHKDKFATTQRKKQVLWEVLAKQIGISGEQCAHRFRNLKQVYTSYVQREITKPEMPILWPYYALCKKVFGYRTIKSKLKNNSKLESDEADEWSARDIKQLINHFGSHFDLLSESDDSGKWQPLAQELGKSETSVYEKFIELRKSYRRLKTMIEQNPDCKVSWKYFNMFDEIYTNAGNVLESEEMEIEEETVYEEVLVEEKNESQDEDDYECIIVIPEGQDLSDFSNAQIIMKDSTENPDDVLQQVMQNINEMPTKPNVTKWNKRSKKKLLILYLNYVRSKKGKGIKLSQMWQDIASQMTEKTPQSCRKMFARLKANHLELKIDNDPNKKKTPYYTLVEKVLAMKPKFVKTVQKELKEGKFFKDVALPDDKVALALQYYLEHIEEFISPKIEKKYLWTEFANAVSEPVNKLFNKINYLKQLYDLETELVGGEPTLFSDLLKEIVIKENLIKSTMDTEPISLGDDVEETWSDEEIEHLLVWYLTNLEKFKNPKYVRKYLWIEASSILEKSPIACSKKMTELRTQYKTMIKENPGELNSWRFFELCQKIYGTGKKTEAASNLINLAQIIEEQVI